MAKVGDAFVEVRPDLDTFGQTLNAKLRAIDGNKEGSRLGQRITASFGQGAKAGIASMVGQIGAASGALTVFAGPAAAIISDKAVSVLRWKL